MNKLFNAGLAKLLLAYILLYLFMNISGILAERLAPENFLEHLV